MTLPPLSEMIDALVDQKLDQHINKGGTVTNLEAFTNAIRNSLWRDEEKRPGWTARLYRQLHGSPPGAARPLSRGYAVGLALEVIRRQKAWGKMFLTDDEARRIVAEEWPDDPEGVISDARRIVEASP